MLINELSMNDIQEDKRQQLLDDLEEKYKWNLDFIDEVAEQSSIPDYTIHYVFDAAEYPNGDFLIEEWEYKVSIQEAIREYIYTHFSDKEKTNYNTIDWKKNCGIYFWKSDKLPHEITHNLFSKENCVYDSIGVPKKISYQPFLLAVLFHEIGHCFTNTYSQTIDKRERNAHAWGLRFMRWIEHRYKLHLRIDTDICELWLLSYHMKYILHKNDHVDTVKTYDNNYEKNKDMYAAITKRGFL
jgi:hypothetical protein